MIIWNIPEKFLIVLPSNGGLYVPYSSTGRALVTVLIYRVW